MASEETLQEKRQTAADLRARIEDEQKVRALIVLTKQREQEEKALDHEIARLNAELDREKTITEAQAKDAGVDLDKLDFNAGAGEAAVVVADIEAKEAKAPEAPAPKVTPLTPPAPPAADAGDKKNKEN